MNKKLISVILPTYNGEKYIKESIESVMKQTYSNWELIIIDDGSCDHTLEIVTQYKKIDRRIRIIHNARNEQLPGSLNIGFKNSRGEFLTWTSDDNIFLPNAFEIMHSYLQEHARIKMVQANFFLINDKGTIIGKYEKKNDVSLILENNVGACFMYRREVYNQIGDYDEELFGVEDYDYWMRIQKEYGEIGHLDKILYKYRIHNNRLTENKKEVIHRNYVLLKEKHREYILSSINNDAKIQSMLYYKLLDYSAESLLLKKLRDNVPEIFLDNYTIGNRDKIVIFGAGDYGEKAQKLLGEKAVFYVDNDRNKIGQTVNGLKVIGFCDLKRLVQDVNIMIAVSKDKIHDISHQLYINKIHNYCTYQSYIRYLADDGKN